MTRLLAGPSHGYDIARADLPILLERVAGTVEERGLAAFVQLPGACLPLTGSSVGECARRVGRRPRLRLLVTHKERIVENIALDLWKAHSDRYVALSRDAPLTHVMRQPRVTLSPVAAEHCVTFPVDAVYTWVDAADPAWQELYASTMGSPPTDADRFVQFDDLRYSLRSLDVFAPWFRRVHILSNCTPPAWFQPSERIRWVDHAQVIDGGTLPLFNSDAIESFIHRVPDLTEHFVYFNDDVMLWDSVTPGTFFTRDGRTIAHLKASAHVPLAMQLAAEDKVLDHAWGRINAARLLEARFGVLPTRNHAHAPFALRRSVLEELEREFPVEMATLRSCRVRDARQVAFVAFLYHHYAELRGSGTHTRAAQAGWRALDRGEGRQVQSIRNARFACFNDGRGSTSDAAFQARKRRALDAALPIASSAEKSGQEQAHGGVWRPG